MSTPVIKPYLLDFGLVSSGQRVTSTFQVHPLSDAEVTAEMVRNDTGSFRVQQVVAYNVTKEPVDPSVLGAPATTKEIAGQAIQEGMRTMIEDGFVKAVQGLTSIEEILRVITE